LFFERVPHFNLRISLIQNKYIVKRHLMIEVREVRGKVCAPELCHGDRDRTKPAGGCWLSKK